MASYLHVLRVDALGYLPEVANAHGLICGVRVPGDTDVINNHFADDSLLSVCINQT